MSIVLDYKKDIHNFCLSTCILNEKLRKYKCSYICYKCYTKVLAVQKKNNCQPVVTLVN